MTGRRVVWIKLAALVLAGLAIAGCASVKKFSTVQPVPKQKAQDSPAPLTLPKPDPPRPLPEPLPLQSPLPPVDVGQALVDINRSLASGEYQRAIDIHVQHLDKAPDDTRFQSSYVATVEEIRLAGDRARFLGDYGKAASTYRVLLDNWKGFSAFEEKLAFKKADVETGLRACRSGQFGAQARQDLGSGRYDKVLATFQSALGDSPGDRVLKEGYAGIVAEVKAAGEKALADHDYARAGKIFRLLLSHLDSFDAIGSGAPVNRKELEDALKLCRTNLTNLGLAEYRKGSLEQAIAIWEGLLAFDPENAEIKKAVDTARIQLGKLKSVAAVGGVQVRTARGSPKSDK